MAFEVTNAVWERSRSTGVARLVLLILADAVNQKRIEAGHPWEAWPSQSFMAGRANCSTRTVRRALGELKDLGEVFETGRKVGRGALVYEVCLPICPPWTPLSRVDDVVQGGQIGSPGRTTSSDQVDDVVHPGRTPVAAEPEENRKKEPEKEGTRSAAAATDVLFPPSEVSLSQDVTKRRAEAEEARVELDRLRAQLPGATGRLREQTVHAITALETELGTEAGKVPVAA